MTNVRGRLATFAVLGNHDGDLLEPRLEQWGVRVLGNTRVELAINDSKLELIGFPGPDRLDVNERFIDSVTRGKNQMPSWGGLLKPEEVEALWAYVVAGGKI